LSEGVHELSLTVVPGDIAEIRDLLKTAIAELSDLYIDITMITGETVDIYRDYDLFAQIVDMKERLENISKMLKKASNQLKEITGEKSGSYISVIDNMTQILDLMVDNRYTAHRYKDSYYSKYTSLASVLYEMSAMPLDIDKMCLSPVGQEKPFKKANAFVKAWFSVEKFFVSFVQDYNNISGTEDSEETVTIWVNWGRDQAQVLNSLIQTSFNEKTGIPVNVQIVNASIIQAILSGKGPDCLLQHSRSEPVNLAMRGVLYDLKNFDDLDQVLTRFQDGAELPYYYKDGLYALPDTQSFYLMYYRTDIFEEMGLKVPTTWDEFEEVVKLLARNNLTAWMPNNTATSTAQANIGLGSINLFPTLLMQKNLDVYTPDGKSTNLSDSKVAVTFNEWTDLYTKLKLPRTLDFYNRFRTGTCPIGISTHTMYTTLKAAAPEIDGLWNVALIPGTVLEDGTINNVSSGGGSSCAILKMSKNPKNAWEFLKWWTDAETQLAYSNEVESVLGPTGRVSASTIEAFSNMEWDSSMKDTIIAAMNQVAEIPEYPGSYYVSRSIYQSFWNVVENNQNPKEMLLKYSEEADEEIARKWKQYENR
ncbi:MAG: extracellular solute-binding protein, partial [Clostridia bacterium]|nr:extracellular solute-binding protein [Clostridia bacterium]